ncbi:hypothetical protein QJS10_CPB18g01514 [Acorus calamus]|uniref:Malic enzyme N-terminal domain-containing protein n=1 Tax=Acorus calamus TaxID=4465 RepID=A0AAV9CNH2_ACOCL|nr:hypothetical protein QJS10_CPB18g01514 [Acorus calamus]
MNNSPGMPCADPFARGGYVVHRKDCSIADKNNLGLRQPRLEGEEYLSIVDEFMEAAFARWPKAVVQFEDFQMKWAFETLHRYRRKFCMFNDDVQGLVTKERRNLDPSVAPFARDSGPGEIEGLSEGASLVEVVMMGAATRK